MKKYIIGITGASGSVIAKKLVEFLASLECELNIVVSGTGEKVFEYETGISINDFIEKLKNNESTLSNIIMHENDNLFSQIASGSNSFDAMFVVPCSMATVGKIANCCGDSLLCRAVDVSLKEGVDVVFVPRESPITSIHLRNLLILTEMGAKIIPPSPMFYNKPETVDEIVEGIVGRVLKVAGVENNLYHNWNGNE